MGARSPSLRGEWIASVRLGGSTAFAALFDRTDGVSESPEHTGTESKLWAEEAGMYKRKESSGVPLSAPGTGATDGGCAMIASGM